MDGFEDENSVEYSLAEAAKIAGISPTTLRKYRDKLKEVGAVQTTQGWKITRLHLVAVGLLSSVEPATTTPPVGGGVCSPQNDDLERRISALEAHNAALQATVDGLKDRLDFAYTYIQQKVIEPPRKRHWWQRND